MQGLSRPHPKSSLGKPQMGFVGRPLVPLWSLTQLGLTWVPQLLHLFHFVLLEILLLVITVYGLGEYMSWHTCVGHL